MNHRRLATIAPVALVGLALGTLVFPTQGEVAQAQTELTSRTTGDLNRVHSYHWCNCAAWTTIGRAFSCRTPAALGLAPHSPLSRQLISQKDMLL